MLHSWRAAVLRPGRSRRFELFVSENDPSQPVLISIRSKKREIIGRLRRQLPGRAREQSSVMYHAGSVRGAEPCDGEATALAFMSCHGHHAVKEEACPGTGNEHPGSIRRSRATMTTGGCAHLRLRR